MLTSEVNKSLGDLMAARDYLDLAIARLQADHDASLPLEQTVFGQLRINENARSVHYGKTSIHLSIQEFDVLLFLVRNVDRVVTRARIGMHLGESTKSVNPYYVDTIVKKLRAKLGPAGDYIATQRGRGFIFHPPAT